MKKVEYRVEDFNFILISWVCFNNQLTHLKKKTVQLTIKTKQKMAFHQSTSIYFGLLLMIFLVPKFGCQHESLPIKINNSNQIIYEHQLKPNKSINNVYDVDNNDDNDWQIGFYIMISLIPIWCLLFGFVIFTIYNFFLLMNMMNYLLNHHHF